ncbi:MAG TPA: sigma-70 family RNA polymerase sigma factor [Labilithrix sp.]|nr:sigma-70 family RNA polymerase sigma factor [Labilithrix sp.]
MVDDRFRTIFLGEFDFACRSLRRLGVREADVHDVAQDLFIGVHRTIDTYDPTRSPRAWLMGFAVRYAANYRRLGWHRGDELRDDAPLPSPRMTDRLAARQLVERGLDALDFDKQVALVMHDLEGISAPEIAAELGIPLNTVYSRVRLARASFKSAIAALETAGGDGGRS